MPHRKEPPDLFAALGAPAKQGASEISEHSRLALKALKLRRDGKDYADIGAALNVTGARARLLVAFAKRMLAQVSHTQLAPLPVIAALGRGPP